MPIILAYLPHKAEMSFLVISCQSWENPLIRQRPQIWVGSTLTTKIRSAEFSTDESNFGLVGNLTTKLPLPVLWSQRIKKMDFSCFDDFFSCFAHDSTDDRKIGKSGMFTYRLTVVKRIRFPRPTPSRRFSLPLAFTPCFPRKWGKDEKLHLHTPARMPLIRAYLPHTATFLPFR